MAVFDTAIFFIGGDARVDPRIKSGDGYDENGRL